MTDQQLLISAIVAEFSVIGAMGMYIASLHKTSKRELKELMIQVLESHAKSSTAVENNTEAMKENTEVLTIVKYRFNKIPL
jgi:hypothetical protein